MRGQGSTLWNTFCIQWLPYKGATFLFHYNQSKYPNEWIPVIRLIASALAIAFYKPYCRDDSGVIFSRTRPFLPASKPLIIGLFIFIIQLVLYNIAILVIQHLILMKY